MHFDDVFFSTEINLICVQSSGQQTTLAFDFEKNLKNRVGTFTHLIGLSPQFG